MIFLFWLCFLFIFVPPAIQKIIFQFVYLCVDISKKCIFQFASLDIFIQIFCFIELQDVLLNTILFVPDRLRQHQAWISDSGSHGSQENTGRKLGGNLRWGAIWKIGVSCQENLNNHHFNKIFV